MHLRQNFSCRWLSAALSALRLSSAASIGCSDERRREIQTESLTRIAWFSVQLPLLPEEISPRDCDGIRHWETVRGCIRPLKPAPPQHLPHDVLVLVSPPSAHKLTV